MNQKRSTSPAPPSIGEEGSDGEILRKYRAINRSTKIIEVDKELDSADEDNGNNTATQQPRDLCPVWRSEDDLPNVAKLLYREAAELAAIPLVVLIRAAAQVERRLEVWCIQRAKERRREKGKGKGKAELVLGVTDSED